MRLNNNWVWIGLHSVAELSIASFIYFNYNRLAGGVMILSNIVILSGIIYENAIKRG